MSFPADTHNFGQRVERESGDSGVYFRKPRPVLWEWLFFSSASPLLPILLKFSASSSPETRLALTENIFCLNVEVDPTGLNGRCREFVSNVTNKSAPSEKELHRFGVLLGYAYVFGIRDLHHENVVRAESGLSVIDTESVFTDLILPHETLLLPFREITYERSALSRLISDHRLIDHAMAAALLRGFFEALNIIATAAAPLAAAVEVTLNKYPPIPIRHILRDTRLYKNWKIQSDQPSAEPFLPEEIVQLERGDVPYFFKFLGSSSVFYYSSRDGKASTVNLPPKMLTGANREAVNPKQLLQPERILDRLLPKSILFLARKLIPDGWQWTFEIGADAKIHFTDETLTLTIGSNSYRALRR